MTDTTEDRILRLIKEQIDQDDITAESERDSLGMDSLDDIELVMAIEVEFDIEVEDDAADQWQTIGDIVAYVKGKIDGQS